MSSDPRPSAGGLPVDALVFGGGVAGLWVMDEVRRRGLSALLVERHALGAGQTIACQGIIHGGIKYTLAGALTPSAKAIRGMPDLWRACLEGRRDPDLREAHVHSACCYLWRTESLSSALGMIGARFGLRSDVERVERAHRPEALAGCPGDVFRVSEPVLEVPSMIRAMAKPFASTLVRIDPAADVEFETTVPGQVERVTLGGPAGPRALVPRKVVFTAGAGNAELRARCGLDAGDRRSAIDDRHSTFDIPPSSVMQLRPLHMVLARGRLPSLYGHCVDGAKTRVTITTATDSQGRIVWQIGGQLSEDGVTQEPDALIERARREVASVLPGLQLDGVEWATYRIDRAEGRTSGGLRPQGPTVREEGNTITAWPTKLALAPGLAGMIADRLSASAASPQCAHGTTSRPEEVIEAVKEFERPDVALPPWEVSTTWRA